MGFGSGRGGGGGGGRGVGKGKEEEGQCKVDNFLGCTDLKTGCIWVGAIGVVFALVFMAYDFYTADVLGLLFIHEEHNQKGNDTETTSEESIRNKMKTSEKYKDDLRIPMVALIAIDLILSLVMLILSIMLIIGAKKEKAKRVKPWPIGGIIYIFIRLAMIILIIVYICLAPDSKYYGWSISALILNVIYLGFLIYCIVVVFSYVSTF